MKYILLSNGSELPIVGLGTWKTEAKEVENVVEIALENGYRHFDTAFNYNTEEPVGKVINRWIDSERVRRDELFITTKLPVWGNRPADVEKYLKLSLSRLNLDYVDLYLMHMPFSFHSNKDSTAPLMKEDGTFSLDTESEISATWKQMEQQVKNGLTRGIGMSNFNEQQVKKVYETAEIKPVVLQVELHAYLQQKELRKACQQMEIAVTAFAPLGSPGTNQHFTKKYNFALDNFPDILGLPVVQELSKKYNKTPGQILLKHLVQQNVSVIPKSSNPERLKANIDLFNFELTREDIQQLDELDREESGRIFNFLFFKGVEKHPEYPFK